MKVKNSQLFTGFSDVTASRSINTSYRNTRGKPILVIADVNCGVDWCQPRLGNADPPTTTLFTISGGAGHSQVTFMVPDLYYYKFVTGGAAVTLDVVVEAY